MGRKVRTTLVYWQKITTIKHPVMSGQESEVIKTLENPQIIKRSEKDENVYLYYKKFAKRFICVVVRHEDGSGFIISCYPVNKIKKGEIVYEKGKSLS